MIFHFLTLNCSSADSTDSMIFPFLISLGLKITEKIQVSLSNLCDDIPFNSSRALPILFGHPTQRNPSRTTIPSTSKVAVFISTPVLTQLNAMKDDSNKMFYIALLKSTHHPTQTNIPCITLQLPCPPRMNETLVFSGFNYKYFCQNSSILFCRCILAGLSPKPCFRIG